MPANLRDFKEALWNGEKGEEWQEIRSDGGGESHSIRAL